MDFRWSFQSKTEKGASWYLWAIALAVALIAWWIFMEIYIMSIVVFIFAGVYMLVENNAPDVMDVAINENGIKVWGSFYDYPKIESFGIVYNGETPYLLRLKLKSRGFRLLDLKMNPDAINTADLRAFLTQYVTEDEKSELTATERLLHYFKV